MAAKKYSAPKPKAEAKKAKKMKEEISTKSMPSPRESTKRLVRQNTRGGKDVSLGDKLYGVHNMTKIEKKAAGIMQTRREADRTRTATRAKGIAAREAAKAKSLRKARSLGN